MKLDKEKFIRGLRNAEAPLVRILGARKLTDQECEDMYEAACKEEEALEAANLDKSNTRMSSNDRTEHLG